MKKCAVVIPFYKSELSAWERVSYLRTVEMLGAYDIFVIQPRGSNFHKSQEFYSKSVGEIEYDSNWFQGISSYNRLMLSKGFYLSFVEYEYILIVQLDAMILNDNIDYFLSQNAEDYFGAPWVGFNICTNRYLVPFLPWYRRFKLTNKMLIAMGIGWHVGNGGVSLRRVKSFLRVLDINATQLIYDLNNFEINEDNFWSFCAKNVCKKFKVAPFSEAIQFAFETAPQESFRLNGFRLPFACHAFEKHDFAFWEKIFRNLEIIK